MSSTNRGAKRRPLDAYYTTDAVARECLSTIADEIRGQATLEPHAGSGAFVRAAMDLHSAVMAIDINPEAGGLSQGVASWVGDYLTYYGSPTWTFGNPPFNRAEEHIRHALNTSRVGAAFLLRLAFLETEKRIPFWKEHPAAEVYVLSRRPSFTGGGTDSAAYGWFVWRKGRSPKAPTLLRHLNWKEGSP